ncbi:MAG: hypothetical protein RJQ01_00795 [Microcella sp.]|uniref:hypothetical protein n=1 Tax=Microcella sp. TaxID=1913979 RepID=UPI003314DFE2
MNVTTTRAQVVICVDLADMPYPFGGYDSSQLDRVLRDYESFLPADSHVRIRVHDFSPFGTASWARMPFRFQIEASTPWAAQAWSDHMEIA